MVELKGKRSESTPGSMSQNWVVYPADRMQLGSFWVSSLRVFRTGFSKGSEGLPFGGLLPFFPEVCSENFKNSIGVRMNCGHPIPGIYLPSVDMLVFGRDDRTDEKFTNAGPEQGCVFEGVGN